jgi:hypothetical protein
MFVGFVSKIGPYPVERITGVQRTNAAVDLSKPPTAGFHRTQGSGWDGAVSVYRSRLAAPHLQVMAMDGKKARIGQAVPFGEMAAAFQNDPGGVETNRWCRCQIEIVGFSGEEPYRFNPQLLDGMAHVMKWCEENLGIPARRPVATWVGADLGAQPWAVESYVRRRAGVWGKQAGWYAHVEIPENDHWDMGEYTWKQLLDAVDTLDKPRTLSLGMKGPDVVTAKKLLKTNRFGSFVVGNLDETYGMEAVSATWMAKRMLGYPSAGIDGRFGSTLRGYLEGKPLPAAYKARRATRLRTFPFRKTQIVVNRSVH